jgi:thiosulfate dehydrogenase
MNLWKSSLSVVASSLLVLAVSSLVNAAEPQVDYQKQLPAAPEGQVTFEPPLERDIPSNQYGDMVRHGRDLFVNTQQLRGKNVFNGQNCVNCHLDAGRLASSAPMWAAFGMYPAYRGKNDKVNTMSERIQGCFTYSMNGIPPESGDDTLVAMETYFHWLSTGAPINQALPGRGYAKLEKPEGGYDRERGAKLYTAQCAVCHGDDGNGQQVAGQVVFPPLWGDGAYNWGAGMHRVNTAAGFIKANMPLGKPNSLSDQDAWDLAAFVNGHERPQDPRRRSQDSLDSTVKTFHNHDGLYGKEVNGKRLGDHDNYGENPGVASK